MAHYLYRGPLVLFSWPIIPRLSRRWFSSLACSLLARSLAMAAATAAGAAVAAAAVSLITCYLLFHNSILKVPSARKARTSCASGRRTRRRGLVEAIGNTPLVRINSLSDATGCEVGMWIFYLFFSALLPEQFLEVVLGLKKKNGGG